MTKFFCNNPTCPNHWHQSPECPNATGQTVNSSGEKASNTLTTPPPASDALSEFPDPDLPATVENVEEFIETGSLDHGNSEVFVQNDEIYMVVEAPNNATMGYSVPEGSTMEDVYELNIAHMEDFDADDEFTEMWSREFGEHNGFSPSGFLEMLQEDEEYFRKTAKQLRGLI